MHQINIFLFTYLISKVHVNHFSFCSFLLLKLYSNLAYYIIFKVIKSNFITQPNSIYLYIMLQSQYFHSAQKLSISFLRFFKD